MNMITYFLLGAGIIMLWFVVGRFEWKVPFRFARSIENIREKKTINDSLSGTHYVRVFMADYKSLKEIEKEVYLMRKKKASGGQEVIMYIYLKTEQLGQTELTKVKSCLERRFSDLTVNFITDQEEGGTCISI